MREICLESLIPAACYQRKITVISILKLVLDAFCRPSSNFVLGKKAMFSEADYKYLKKVCSSSFYLCLLNEIFFNL